MCVCLLTCLRVIVRKLVSRSTHSVQAGLAVLHDDHQPRAISLLVVMFAQPAKLHQVRVIRQVLVQVLQDDSLSWHGARVVVVWGIYCWWWIVPVGGMVWRTSSQRGSVEGQHCEGGLTVYRGVT